MAQTFPPFDWAMEQRLQSPTRGNKPRTLQYLQSWAPEVQCHVYLGDRRLDLGDGASTWFRIEPSPLQSFFVLELRLLPPPSGPKADEYVEERMHAAFLTYDGHDERAYPRTVHAFNGHGGEVIMPSGPLDFSRQLYDVRYWAYADSPLRGIATPWPGAEAGQMCFSWKARQFPCFAVSRPTAHLPPAAATSAAAFKALLDQAGSTAAPIRILTKNNPKFASAWARFASLPVPTPVSFWPWLRKLVKEPKDGEEIMNFADRNFELVPQYINCALALRNEGWYLNKDAQDNPKTVENAQLLPDPLTITSLPAKIRYNDYREYLAHVLGGHAYEHQEDMANLSRYYNGYHKCEVFPDEAGSRKHIILLNIRFPARSLASDTAAMESSEQTLPEVGERVGISIVIDRDIGEEEWQGTVIRIPGDYLKYGRNVAIEAVRPAAGGGRVLSSRVLEANFYFGHHGTLVTKLRESIINVMTSTNTTKDGWFQKFVLAQDNYNLPNKGDMASLPANWKEQVDEVCGRERLNIEQRDSVLWYFTHRFSIIVGPPGTGKSTLIAVLLELEERFGQNFWVCTASNAAVDVLAVKFAQYKGNDNPDHYYRINPLYRERLDEEDEHGGLVGALRPLAIQHPDAPATPDAAQAIRDQLQRQQDSATRMSLGVTIKRRMELVAGGRLGQLYYKEERDDLLALQQAQAAVSSIKLQSSLTPAEAQELEADARFTLRKALRKVQSAYSRCARGVFSTDAAASGPLLHRYPVNALIIDEASQMFEARAVSALLHARASTGPLRRFCLVGDHWQLPPTLKALRNAFSASGQLSLLERLIKAGTPYIQLAEQFRMHPSISSIVNMPIYNGTLRDGASTTRRDEIAKFMRFIQLQAEQCGIRRFPETCAVVVSPTQSPDYHWGSQNRRGSNSRFNRQTAMMVFKQVYWLVKYGHFSPKDILVTAFYADQVTLLKALFVDDEMFAGLQVYTVDGSQGKEALVEVVDCVTLGHGANESMGFLAGEKRRFNVAMSRGKVGLIVIAHQDFAKRKGATVQKGVWDDFLKDFAAKRWVMGDGAFRQGWEINAMRQRFEEVSARFMPRTTDNVGHANLSGGPRAEVRAAPSTMDYNRAAFIEATGSSVEAADRYLTDASGELHIAVDRYFQAQGGDDDVEEIWG